KLEAIQPPFPRMSYDDAVKILQSKGSEIQWGGDFGGTDETLLSAGFDRPLMVDRYPTAVKAFYMQPDPQRPEVALGVDVLGPDGMGKSHIAIVGAALDLGQDRRGVDMGPSAVRVANLNKRLAGLGYEVEDLGNLPVEQPESLPEGPAAAKYLPQIAGSCMRL